MGCSLCPHALFSQARSHILYTHRYFLGYVFTQCVYLNRDYKGRTPVHFAAQSGHSGLLITLLRAGGSPTCPDKTGYTPLHWASYNGIISFVYIFVFY